MSEGTETSALNIYQKLNEVRKVVEYIQKEAKKPGGLPYSAVRHDQVNEKLRPALIEQGIIAEPHLIKGKSVATGKATRSGSPFIRYEAVYDIHFVNCDNPTERAIVTISAHAEDEGDKAPGKAISYAVKYAELKLFNISTGDDDEARVDAIPESEALQQEAVRLFSVEMLNAIDENDPYPVGRANISKQDLYQRAHHGTPGKGDGYFTAPQKKIMKEMAVTYGQDMQAFADQLNSLDDIGEIRKLLDQLGDDPTDKRTVWQNLNEITKGHIEKLKENSNG